MLWAYPLTYTEWLFVGLFVLLYAFYLIRMFRLGKMLGNPTLKLLPKLLLRSGAFALLIIALLGPSFGETSREIKSIGKDIFVCLDLSQSMNATDIQPTRLEKVKFEIQNIVEAFHSDRIGLIMFSNEAFMQCPLTYDNNALNLFIQTLNTGLVPNTGTDFGPPLKMALDKFKKEDEAANGRRKTQIIILISDGEDFGEETDDIAENIESAGIRLYTLGVGTPEGSRIPTSRGFKKDREGNEVVSQLNPGSLKSLAQDTKGQYFEINNRKNDVERLINAINNIEGELRDVRQVDAKTNKYFYFLIAALGLLILDMLFQLKVFSL
jgi:Ca-activated chloride channel family protein